MEESKSVSESESCASLSSIFGFCQFFKNKKNFEVSSASVMSFLECQTESPQKDGVQERNFCAYQRSWVGGDSQLGSQQGLQQEQRTVRKLWERIVSRLDNWWLFKTGCSFVELLPLFCRISTARISTVRLQTSWFLNERSHPRGEEGARLCVPNGLPTDSRFKDRAIWLRRNRKWKV